MVTDHDLCDGREEFFLFIEDACYYVLSLWPAVSKLPVKNSRCSRVELDLSKVANKPLYITFDDLLSAWDSAFE